LRLWRSRAEDRALYCEATAEGAGGTRGKRWTTVHAFMGGEDEEEERRREGRGRAARIKKRML
jgi:hypothetical protein